MILHPWWDQFGLSVQDIDALEPGLASDLVSLVERGGLPGIAMLGVRRSSTYGSIAVALEVDVERPQDLAHPIKAVEPVAIVAFADGSQPSVVSLRPDFPDTFHQNWAPPGGPYALCIDDRPWAEARLTASAYDILRRTQLWLSKAARGELHDPAQPPDPLFFNSPRGLVLPMATLSPSEDPVELTAFIRPENQGLIIARPASPTDQHTPSLTVLALHAKPQAMARLRHAPRTLTDLATELEPLGIRLIDHLKGRLQAWCGLDAENSRRLSTHLAIIVIFPVEAGGRAGVNDVRAFLTCETAGEIGVALGVLYANNSGVGDKGDYMRAISEASPSSKPLSVEPAQVHFTLDRRLAAAIAGRSAPDQRSVVMIGAGSLGSQLANNLVREGAFSWTIVDDDHVLPHNLARHALFAGDTGAPKAVAVAARLSGLLGEPADGIICNVLRPDGEAEQSLTAAFQQADVILDTSASVAVSRHLADLDGVSARRLCAFFNPAGTSVVLLAESADRSITLRDLEAEYHRLLLTESGLGGHLGEVDLGVRYTGSCRALTNRIPASSAAILSALAAKGVAATLNDVQATITVWTLSPIGEVQRIHRVAAPVSAIKCAEWDVTFDAGLIVNLSTMRCDALPNETGGVLLGIVDRLRKSIHIAHALPPPNDSIGTPSAFKRGISGLATQVNAASAATLHQLQYIGEWHSHPDRTSVSPSTTDCVQLLWLGGELAVEGLPGLMMIAGQDGRFAIAVAVGSDATPGA
jgi:integrative and conjugative element protein (TIGR02256 family)